MPEAVTPSIYGTAASGLWKSTDRGASWSYRSASWQSQAVGAVVVDPNDINIVYAGTGTVNEGAGGGTIPGDGVYKSIDGGSVWTLFWPKQVACCQLAISPTNAQRLYLTTTEGIYLSYDGGISFTKVFPLSHKALSPLTPPIHQHYMFR